MNKVEEWSGSIEPCSIAGAHHVVICNTPDAHKVEIALRQKGYEIRDSMKWLYSANSSIQTKTVILGRRSLEGTVAENVLKYGTGALNIDGCRVGTFQNTTPSGADRLNAKLAEMGYRPAEYQMGEKLPNSPEGRWPANVLHDGSEAVVALFPFTSNTRHMSYTRKGTGFINDIKDQTEKRWFTQESGPTARFFYNTSQDGEGVIGLIKYLERLVGHEA